jgi:hypothetical protein
VFPSEKVIVSREILSGAYPASAYFISRVVAELPGQCVLTGMIGVFCEHTVDRWTDTCDTIQFMTLQRDCTERIKFTGGGGSGELVNFLWLQWCTARSSTGRPA